MSHSNSYQSQYFLVMLPGNKQAHLAPGRLIQRFRLFPKEFQKEVGEKKNSVGPKIKDYIRRHLKREPQVPPDVKGQEGAQTAG